MEIDSEFLRKNKIVDYSFLVGIHKVEKNREDQQDLKDLKEHRFLNENSSFDKISERSDNIIELVEQREIQENELENYSISTRQVMSESDSESLLPNKEFHHPFKDVS